MAFTSKLGTAESYLGNIELGIGGTPSGNYDDSLSIDGVCDITINQLFAFTLTIDGVSDCDVLDGFRYLNTLQLDGEADFTILDGTSFQNSVTVDGFAATTIFAADFVTLAIDGIADITPTGLLVMRPTQTVDGVSAITLSPQYSLLNTITIAGIGDFFSPGGVASASPRSAR